MVNAWVEDETKKVRPKRPPGTGRGTGRKPGAKNKNTIKREELTAILMESGRTIVDKAIELAQEGDSAMIRLVMDKILPTLKAAEIKADHKISIDERLMDFAKDIANEEESDD